MNILVSWKECLLFFLPHNVWAFAKKYGAALNKQKYMFVKVVGPLIALTALTIYVLHLRMPEEWKNAIFMVLFFLIPPTLGIYLVALSLRFSSVDLIAKNWKKVIVGFLFLIALLALYYWWFMMFIPTFIVHPYVSADLLLKISLPLLCVFILHVIFFLLGGAASFAAPLRPFLNALFFLIYHLPVMLVFCFISYWVIVMVYNYSLSIAPDLLRTVVGSFFSKLHPQFVDALMAATLFLFLYPTIWILLNAYSVYFDEQVQK